MILLACKPYEVTFGSILVFSNCQNETYIYVSCLASIQLQLQIAVSVTCNSGRLCFNMRIKHLSPKRRGLDIHLGFLILKPDPTNDGMPSITVLNPFVALTCPFFKISLRYFATQQNRRVLHQAAVHRNRS